MPSRLTESHVLSISTPHGAIAYRLDRSSVRKKTMHISIHPPGEVVVCAPFKFTLPLIERFLERKALWIIDKLHVVKERHNAFEQQNNSLECLYLGEKYPITHCPSDSSWGKIVFHQEGWIIQIPQKKIDSEKNQYALDFLLKWFKSRAGIILEERVGVYAKTMGVQAESINIRSPKGLWGSCHPVKRVLHFNWKIIMAPLEVMDYIVIHELCHIKVPDHSKSFWALVNAFCPAYKQHQQWLKINGHQLRLPLRIFP